MPIKPTRCPCRGCLCSDLNIFLFLTVLMLVFGLFGLLQKDIEWAVFPGLGIILGLFFHTALLADGSITEVSGGTTTAILSASTAVSNAWLAVQYIPLLLTVTCSFVAIYRVGKAFA